MKKPRIIIDDKIPYIKGLLETEADVEYMPYGEMTNSRIKAADALVIRTRTHCDKELLEGTSVRLIVTATIGMDHINPDYCQAHGITVRNAPGCNASSVAQWVREAVRVTDDKSVRGCFGVVGLGHVGSRVKEMAESLGYRTLVSDPYKGHKITIEEMADVCDIISFHTPLTTTGDYPTRGMAGRAFFDRLRPGACVINAARGGIVVESELKRWLKTNPDGRCAIDCWENEPEIDRELLGMASVSTPHIAGYSADGKWNGTRMAVEAVNGFFNLNAPLPAPLPSATQLSIGANHAPTSYDITVDSNALKHYPAKFEWFRSHYPERRE